jgi:hypothetical protein
MPKDLANAMMVLAWGAIWSRFLNALVLALLTALLSVFTVIPFFTFKIQDSIVVCLPLDRPGTSTTHSRQEPEGLSEG